MLQELSKIFTAFKKKLISKSFDAAIIIMMSHGGNGEICLTGSTDNTANLMNDILMPFSNSNFGEFRNKPKIFISQACQIFQTSDYTQNVVLNTNRFSDMLICLSSLPGYEAYRSKTQGSIFIYSLVRNICQHAKFEDVVNILELVSYCYCSIFYSVICIILYNCFCLGPKGYA